MKKSKIVIIAIFIVVVFVVFFERMLPSVGINTTINTNEKRSITIAKEIFYRQTLNNCAPYSAMAVINIV